MQTIDTQKARRIARQLYPNATTLKTIDHGYNNIVILVDNDFAIKFPRDDNAALNNSFEASILPYFVSIKNVHIPQVVRQCRDPNFTIYVQVLGDPLDKHQLASLPKKSAETLGEEIAQFAFDLHNSISTGDLLKIKQQLNFDPELLAWPSYLQKALENCNVLTPNQNHIARYYYKKWLDLDKNTNRIAIHDDLHKNNLLTINNHLSGVIDFGDMSVGTAEQELRLILSLNDTVYKACVNRYETISGKKINQDAIFIWAAVQELSKYATYTAQAKTNLYSFKRAQKFLNQWLPEGKW